MQWAEWNFEEISLKLKKGKLRGQMKVWESLQKEEENLN